MKHQTNKLRIYVSMFSTHSCYNFFRFFLLLYVFHKSANDAREQKKRSDQRRKSDMINFQRMKQKTIWKIFMWGGRLLCQLCAYIRTWTTLQVLTNPLTSVKNQSKRLFLFLFFAYVKHNKIWSVFSEKEKRKKENNSPRPVSVILFISFSNFLRIIFIYYIYYYYSVRNSNTKKSHAQA